MKRVLLTALTLVATLAGPVLPARAGDIITEWGEVKTPPAPALKPVTIDSKSYALLIIDMVKETCNEKARPRCVETIPPIAKLLNEARAKGVTVIILARHAGKRLRRSACT